MSAEKSPAFQFYPRDFLADANVQAMTMEQRGIYITLMCHCWLDGSLPADVSRLARICHMSGARFGAAWPDVAICFAPAGDDRIVQLRLDRERVSQKEFHEGASIGGKASAESRRRKFGSANPRSNREPNVNPTVHDACEADVNSSSSSSSSSSKKKEIALSTMPFRDKRLTVEECFGPSEDPTPNPEADSVGRVVDLWTKEFADAHNGATSMPASQKDYDAMRHLAKSYPDLGHLAKMLRFFFRANDLPDWAMLKTPPAFVRMAPLTDEKVRTSR